jgi:N-acetylneuraminic acid mutarotase
MKNILLLSLFIFCIYFNAKSQLPIFTITEMASMPKPISNNAVVEGWANGTAYVYSFGGIDSTKIWSGITKKAFRYNTITDFWDTIPELPNPNAVIASGASYVDSLIYIIGGYQVLSNGNEISSNIVNRYDPRTNTYLSNGAPIPVPIDDHVQAVWNDSLIYMITGWSNTTNVPNVQIYDPTNDNWLVGTSTPNNNVYKAFGASGTIMGDTIYYHGGANTGFNFPGQSTLRKGYINPTNPTQITWTNQTTNYISYRAAAFNVIHYVCWLGGSEITYNYNGIAYNGSGGVPLKSKILAYNSLTNEFDTTSSAIPILPMDLRGGATLSSDYYIAGGMLENQTVSNKSYKITAFIDQIKENKNILFSIYPNPTSSQINLLFDKIENKTILLIDILGNKILTQESNSNNIQLNVSNYPKGIYFVTITSKKGSSTQKIIIK